MKINIKYRIISIGISWLIYAHSTVFAQSPTFFDNKNIGVNFYAGKFLKHSRNQTFTVDNPVVGFGAEIMKQTDGSRFWHILHGYPRIGMATMFKSFGRDSILGWAFGLYPQLDIPIKKGDKLNLYVRAGFGLAYLNKPWSRESNPQNTAIGSYINNITTAGVIAEYALSPHWQLRAGAHLTHTSNGRTRIPNLGLNTAKLSIGTSYVFNPHLKKITMDNAPYPIYPMYKKIFWGARFGMSIHEYKMPEGPFYPVYIASLSANKYYRHKAKVSLGVEYSYDLSNKEYALNQEIEPFRLPHQRWTVFGAHEFLFGRLGWYNQLFFYADRPFKGNSFMGTKIGANIYALQPHLHPRRNAYWGIYLKSHYAVADYVEMTVGGTF